MATRIEVTKQLKQAYRTGGVKLRTWHSTRFTINLCEARLEFRDHHDMRHYAQS